MGTDLVLYPWPTNVRRPLLRIGQLAAKTLIDQIEGTASYVPELVVEPELVVLA